MQKQQNLTNINCEEQSNAKPPKSVGKWTLYQSGIFRNLIKNVNEETLWKKLDPNFKGIELKTFENKEYFY